MDYCKPKVGIQITLSKMLFQIYRLQKKERQQELLRILLNEFSENPFIPQYTNTMFAEVFIIVFSEYFLLVVLQIELTIV